MKREFENLKMCQFENEKRIENLKMCQSENKKLGL